MKLFLVDQNDNAIGIMDKLEAHQKGVLHRAISVMVGRFTTHGLELCLQKRAACKYHSENLWSNTCDTHPSPEHLSTLHCAEERLMFEMGMKAKEMRHIGTFIYCSPVSNNLIEHELDHVFFALCDEEPILNPEEASEYKWVPMNEVYSLWSANKEDFAVWFIEVFSFVLDVNKKEECA